MNEYPCGPAPAFQIPDGSWIRPDGAPSTISQSNTPIVFVGMPCYGSMTLESARGLYAPSAGGVIVRTTMAVNHSVAPVGFNSLFGQALIDRDEGLITHFAMIHSDIDPCIGWLDILWHEMRAHQATLMAAVITIKDDLVDPFTSTAVGVADDPWPIRRRIKISERWCTPETFGAEHVCEEGEVLLVNTGLWLADLRHPCWDEFEGFNVHSRIVKVGKGRRVDLRPEDWELSRFLHARGVKYMATWKPEVNHRGMLSWPNREILPGRLNPSSPPAERKADREFQVEAL